jgi:tetratricopeptide (TPR) repeat protein
VRNIYVLALAVFALVLQAGLARAHGGYDELIDAQTRKVEKNPSDAALRFELGNLHGLHGDLEPALKDLARVDALAPGKFLTDLMRGQAYFVARDFAKTKDALDRQLVSHPESVRAWLLRARAERELGQHEASLRDYREALKRNASPDPDIVQEVADALAARDKKEEAAQVLAAGMEKVGKVPSLMLRALDLEIETKNFDAALRRIEEARADAPRPEPWMARRAAVLAQAGRLEESRAAWTALRQHLDALPEHDRTSRAMTQLADEACRAVEPAPSK